MIETCGLTKRFDDFLAVDGVGLAVRAGEVLALLGPNGAGKTTTVRMLTSILAPTAGWARVAGYDVVRDADKVRANVGVLTEHHGLYLRMRGVEYLDFYGELYGIAPDVRRRRAAELLERFGMGEAAARRLGEYSKGMRQKLALIRAMLHDPPVLLLDEPTSAMDPQSAKLVRDSIAALRGERRAIIICTHNLFEAETLADRIAIIRRGRIVTQGTPAALKTELLGPPVMELRLTGALNGLAEDLADMVEVVARGENWLRYRTTQAEHINPLILQRLADQRVHVVTL
ncbi:MAG: ABC transporter ATP-binding protein, partial [Chloroflexi bacterium]|nr:ABC transporter ATP-binding protein [Chloroflexota bacterium]